MNEKQIEAAREIIAVLQKNSINADQIVDDLNEADADWDYGRSEKLFTLVSLDLRGTAAQINDSWTYVVGKDDEARIEVSIHSYGLLCNGSSYTYRSSTRR